MVMRCPRSRRAHGAFRVFAILQGACKVEVYEPHGSNADIYRANTRHLSITLHQVALTSDAPRNRYAPRRFGKHFLLPSHSPTFANTELELLAREFSRLIQWDLLDGGPSQDTWAALWLAEAIKARPGQPGFLRPGILVNRRRFFSLVPHGPLTSADCASPDPASTKVPATVVPSSPPTPWLVTARTQTRTKSQRQTTTIGYIRLCFHPWPKAGHTAFYVY